MAVPPYISADFINQNTVYKELVEELRKGFASNQIITPDRHHHDFPNSTTGQDSTMLLMPSWQDGEDAGVKVVTVSPDNSRYDLPSIQGSYIYLNAITGQVKAIIDAKSLTSKRTAAASALASSYLSLPESSSLLVLGTGALSSELIAAHVSMRPLTKVWVWGRNFQKAEKVCQLERSDKVDVMAVKAIEDSIDKVDIVCAATMSSVPLIRGSWLKEGQHIDLIGSFKPHMREADDEVIRRSEIYADVRHMAIKESGDLQIPISRGIINENDIKADLIELCSSQKEGREDENTITLFKSVGHALEDLIAARYYYQKFVNV